MTPDEVTQCFNLAKALGLVVSSQKINGILYVYTPTGVRKAWDSFVTEYPLERLKALVNRMQIHYP